MTLFRPFCPGDDSDESCENPDPSRRAFLGGLGTLLIATPFGLMPSTSEAVGDAFQQQSHSGSSDPVRHTRPYNQSYQHPPPYQRPPTQSYQHYAPQSHASYNGPYRPLPSGLDSLSATIQRHIGGLRRAGQIPADEQTAWLIYDFTTHQYLAAINAKHPYQSASMIKPFIALAFFHKVQEGRLQYTPYRRKKMEAMIQRSNNGATNYFISLLGKTGRGAGPTEVERTLKHYHPGVFRDTRIVEEIPRGGRAYRNKASAMDYHRFLHALWYNRLPYSDELKRLMNLPGRDRVYSGASSVPQGTWVFDKTGTTARLCGDMGILVARGQNGGFYPYTFVGIIEKSRRARNYRSWKNHRGDVIREVSNMAYNHMRTLHNLV